MTDLQVILQATIKMMKIFPLVLPATIVGLAVLAVEERRVTNVRKTFEKYRQLQKVARRL